MFDDLAAGNDAVESMPDHAAEALGLGSDDKTRAVAGLVGGNDGVRQAFQALYRGEAAAVG